MTSRAGNFLHWRLVKTELERKRSTGNVTEVEFQASHEKIGRRGGWRSEGERESSVRFVLLLTVQEISE